MPRYRRVVIKLSGQAFAGPGGCGVDRGSLTHLADEVVSVRDLGVQVAVVVGGGNHFRGRMARVHWLHDPRPSDGPEHWDLWP